MEPLNVNSQDLALVLSCRPSTGEFISPLLPRRLDYTKTFETWLANWCHMSFPWANPISFLCWELNWFWYHSHKCFFGFFFHLSKHRRAGAANFNLLTVQAREKNSFVLSAHAVLLALHMKDPHWFQEEQDRGKKIRNHCLLRHIKGR